jgi:hypothetical protein
MGVFMLPSYLFSYLNLRQKNFAPRFCLKMLSERIPRCLRRGWRANFKNDQSSLHLGDTLQLAAGFFNLWEHVLILSFPHL